VVNDTDADIHDTDMDITLFLITLFLIRHVCHEWRRAARSTAMRELLLLVSLAAPLTELPTIRSGHAWLRRQQ